jgi:transposase
MARASRPRPGERGRTAPQASDTGAVGSRAAGPNLLNWPHWEVRRLEEGEHAYQLAIALRRAATACQRCGVVGQLERFGTQQPLFLDLPIHGKQVALRVLRQRYRCTAWGRTFLEPLADMD